MWILTNCMDVPNFDSDIDGCSDSPTATDQDIPFGPKPPTEHGSIDY